MKEHTWLKEYDNYLKRSNLPQDECTSRTVDAFAAVDSFPPRMREQLESYLDTLKGADFERVNFDTLMEIPTNKRAQFRRANRYRVG